ncbi:NAD-P-binding protein [Daedaleopsis nitida]|nr:NAD-P-binding protein [Daedaleopsis nitida]
MPSVTIVGGTGGLGQEISDAFLTTFRSSFPTVRVLTRDPSGAKAQSLKGKGAELHKLGDGNIGEALDEAFAGVDVIVNALPGNAPKEIKHAVVDAVVRSSTKVYFLSEYGVDHRLNDFPGYEHPEWSGKQDLAARARGQAKGKKIIALYTGPFLEIVFAGPILGFDIANNTFTTYGSPSTKLSSTSRVDIAKAIARLSILALDPATSAKVPDELRIAGSTTTIEEIRDVVARVKGVEKGKIVSEDLAAHKKALSEKPGENFLGYLRVILGEGKVDFTDNSNELVNPSQSLWKWKTVEEQIRSL